MKKYNYTNIYTDSPSKEEKYTKTVLENGLKIISEDVNSSESFALGFTINIGSRDDISGLDGIAHLIEHTLFRRTKNYTGRQLINKFESLGAYINAYTTKEVTCYYVKALKNHFEECFELLAEVVFSPKFNDSDIKKEKSIIIEEIKSYEDDPEEFIFDTGEALIFENTSLAHPIAGSVQSLKQIKFEDVTGFYDEKYQPENIVITLSGPIEHDRLLRVGAKAGLNDMMKSARINKRDTPLYKKGNLIIKEDYQQSHLLYLAGVCPINSIEKYPIAIVNSLLGDGLSSRLNQRIREKYGYVYTIYSSISLMTDIGSIGIYSATNSQKIDRLQSLIKAEIENLTKANITEAEFVRAKEQIKSSTVMALESMSDKMQSLAKSEIGLGYNETVAETFELVDKVTKEEVQSVIKKYLAPENWSEIVILSK